MRQSQGKRANTNGQSAEDTIAAILMARRYIPQRQYLIGISIFQSPLYADFYLDDIPTFPHGLIIESKWQEVSGSVDEKLPYLVANIQDVYPCPTVIVLHGKGYRLGAAAWLRRQVGGNLIGVVDLEGFLTWANHNL